ncbi:hypothetical protein [Isoptericola sp. NPDC057559]
MKARAARVIAGLLLAATAVVGAAATASAEPPGPQHPFSTH